MTPSSFTFGTINLCDKYGIKCIKHDVLSPAKRRGTLTIPKRSGVYIEPGKVYDERLITVECRLPKPLTGADVREIAYDLSDRKSLYFWDEPDLHYDAELVDPSEVFLWPAYAGMDVEIQFVAFPFALSALQILPLQSGVNPMTSGGTPVYHGTAETPCLIILKNNNDFDITNVQIVVTRRRT